MTIVVDPELSSPSGTTLDDIVGRVRRELGDRDNINLLASSVDEVTDQIVFRHSINGVSRGTLISVDSEEMYVWDVETNSKTLTVQRGFGSSPEPHNADALVNIGEKTRRRIVQAINDELASISGRGLFQMKSTPVSGYTSSRSAFSVPALTGHDIYDVQYLPWGDTLEWTHLSGWQYSSLDAIVNVPASVHTSGVRVLYKTGFGQLIDGTDDVQTTSGLHAEATDILVWGACARLATSEEYKRNDFRAQGDTRRPEEVPPRALAVASQQFAQMRDTRLMEEKDRLRRQFPLTRNGW